MTFQGEYIVTFAGGTEICKFVNGLVPSCHHARPGLSHETPNASCRYDLPSLRRGPGPSGPQTDCFTCHNQHLGTPMSHPARHAASRYDLPSLRRRGPGPSGPQTAVVPRPGGQGTGMLASTFTIAPTEGLVDSVSPQPGSLPPLWYPCSRTLQENRKQFTLLGATPGRPETDWT